MIPTQQDIAEFTRFQRNEITESILYERLASIEKDENNRKTLRLIAAEEKSHYAILKKYTGKEIGPDYKRIARFYFLARILGITFAIKLMESRANKYSIRSVDMFNWSSYVTLIMALSPYRANI